MGFYDGFAELGRKLRRRAHTRILKKAEVRKVQVSALLL